MGKVALIPFFILYLVALVPKTVAKTALQQGVKVLYLDDKKIASVGVNPNGMVLSFPVKPQKVILGRKDGFDVQYVSNDIAIAPLSLTAKSNLFVYLLGRRYSFRLSVVPKHGDEIVLVRDASEATIKVKQHD